MYIQFGKEVCLQAPSKEGLERCIRSYQDGFETGADWPVEWNYIPGGPWVYSGHSKELRKQSEEHHAAWMRGFHNGIKVNANIPEVHGARR